MSAITLDLTTIFTPPTSCLQPTFTLSPSGSDVYSGGTVTRGIDPECYPSDFQAIYERSTITGSAFVFVDGTSSSTGYSLTSYQSFYSPGACPSGYTTATAVWNSSTFFATCCPSDYSLGASSATGDLCTHTILGDYLTLIGETSNQTLPYPATAVAAPILIASAATDEAILTSAVNTQTSTGLASPGATPGSATPSASSPAPSGLSSESQLSTGAQAGIGVGVSIAVIIVAGVGFLVFHRRRNRTRAAQVESSPGDEKSWDKPELGGESARLEAPDTAAMPHELDAMAVRAEMPGDFKGSQVPGHDLSIDHRHEAPA